MPGTDRKADDEGPGPGDGLSRLVSGGCGARTAPAERERLFIEYGVSGEEGKALEGIPSPTPGLALGTGEFTPKGDCADNPGVKNPFVIGVPALLEYPSDPYPDPSVAQPDPCLPKFPLMRDLSSDPAHLDLKLRPILTPVASAATIPWDGSDPATTSIALVVIRRAYEVQTKTPPSTPTQLQKRMMGLRRSDKKGDIAPNEQLDKGCCTLMNGQTHGVQIKLEKNSRRPTVVLKDTCIVGDAVLVGVNWF